MELLSRCSPPDFQPGNEKPVGSAQIQGGPNGLLSTWTAGVPPCVAARQPGREEVGHVSLMEAGFWAVHELSRAQEVGLPLHVRAPR